MKHTIDGFIVYYQTKWSTGRFDFVCCDMTGVDGYTPVKPYSIEVEIADDFDPRLGQIESLKEKQREAGAAFAALTTEINKQISELEAIEYVAAV